MGCLVGDRYGPYVQHGPGFQTGNSANYGGIAGMNTGKIVESSFEGEININCSGSNLWAGGIAGYNSVGIVEACCNTGAITAVNNVDFPIEIGGIVGRTTNNGVVAACYNTGNVSADVYIQENSFHATAMVLCL